MVAWRILLVGAVLVVAATPGLSAQVTSSSRAISPTVVSSHLARGGELVLMVLWRGSPGWFWRGEGGATGSGGSSDAMFQLVRAGGHSFRIDYDFRANTATVQGIEVSLSETNVVLLNNVDDPAGPGLAGTLRTDPRVNEPLHPELVVVRRHFELYQFLQCDLLLPRSSALEAPLRESLIKSLCDQMRPQ